MPCEQFSAEEMFECWQAIWTKYNISLEIRTATPPVCATDVHVATQAGAAVPVARLSTCTPTHVARPTTTTPSPPQQSVTSHARTCAADVSGSRVCPFTALAAVGIDVVESSGCTRAYSHASNGGSQPLSLLIVIHQTFQPPVPILSLRLRVYQHSPMWNKY